MADLQLERLEDGATSGSGGPRPVQWARLPRYFQRYLAKAKNLDDQAPADRAMKACEKGLSGTTDELS